MIFFLHLSFLTCLLCNAPSPFEVPTKKKKNVKCKNAFLFLFFFFKRESLWSILLKTGLNQSWIHECLPTADIIIDVSVKNSRTVRNTVSQWQNQWFVPNEKAWAMLWGVCVTVGWARNASPKLGRRIKRDKVVLFFCSWVWSYLPLLLFIYFHCLLELNLSSVCLVIFISG